MLLQTNSYIVPKEKRAEHARLMRRFRQILNRVGCDQFEIYEQVGANWTNGQTAGRFVQIMRFRDRRHQLAVQNAERTDPAAQQLIAEFCELINYPYQQQQQQFAVGFYSSVLPVAPQQAGTDDAAPAGVAEEGEPAAAEDFGASSMMAAEVLEDEQPAEAAVEAESEFAPVGDAETQPQADAENELEQPLEETIAAEPNDSDLIAEAGEDTLVTDQAEADAVVPAVASEPEGEETLSDELFAEDDLSLPQAPVEAAPEHAAEIGGEMEIDPFEQATEPLDDELLLDDSDTVGEANGKHEPEEDDDISRLAEELSAGEADLRSRSHRPQRRGPASENGAH